jgi:hypothetical protein
MKTVLPIDGTQKRVDSMTAEEFLDVAEMLLSQLSSEGQWQTRKWLYDLDYSTLDYSADGSKEFRDRWYTMEQLLQLGVKLPEQKVGAA